METLIVLPVALTLVALLVAAGYVVIGRGVVRSAANEGARAASLARDADQAVTLAQAAASTTFDNSDHRCQDMAVVVDTTGFAVPLGQHATVSVTVTCHVPLTPLGVPGLDDREVVATASASLDTYRRRQ
ncbi:MAG: pilus assembly protein [Micrococcales bacterium]|nr:pilus assembly protein [Micrococcales bacterium]